MVVRGRVWIVLPVATSSPAAADEFLPPRDGGDAA